MISKKYIENYVDQLLKDMKINTIPVPLNEITDCLNISVQEEKFEKGDLSGILIRNSDNTIIGVNACHSENRRRFTIAHELGHYFFHKGSPVHIDRKFRVNFRDGNSSLAVSSEEIEANAFAAALLMPERKIKEVVKSKFKQGIDIEDSIEIRKIAKQFKVSQQALIIRLINLKLIDDFGI